MQTARRLYLYAMSGITLGVLLIGLSMLLRVLFVQAGLPAGWIDEPGFGGPDRDEMLRQDLATAWAMIGVGLPVWLIHWFIVQRSTRRGDGAEAERGSPIRALYLALVLTAVAAFALVAAISLLRDALIPLLGGDLSFRDTAGPLGVLLATALAWSYHAFVRIRDTGHGELTGPAAWWPRGYLYVAAFVGAMLVLTGAGDLVQLGIQSLLGTSEAVPSPANGDPFNLDAYALGDALATLIAGSIVWVGHWLYAQRLQADPGWRGRSEQPARLRLAYFVAIIFVSAAAVIGFGSRAAQALLLEPLGATAPSPDAVALASAALVPLAAALPFAVAWRLHLGWLRRESAALGPERTATADRLDLYAVALVGLAAGAGAIAWLLGLGIDVVLGGDRFDGRGVRGELAQALPLALLGLAAWTWKWRLIRARVALDPAAEGGSTLRRAFLFLILAGSVIAGLAGLGTLLYRAFGELFGVAAPTNIVSELSTPAGVLVMAVVVGLFHGLLLRRELAGAAAPPPTAPGRGAGRWLAAEEGAMPSLAARSEIAWMRRPIAFTGESAGLRLFQPETGTLLAAASWWRADYSEAGSGQALFVWLAPQLNGAWSGPVAFTDAPALAEHLALRIARHLPEFADLQLDEAPAQAAILTREGDLAARLHIEAAVGEHRVVVAWREPLDRRLMHWPGFPLGPAPLDLTTVMVPCAAADLVIDGTPVEGEVGHATGDERSQSSAYVAASQTWSQPESGAQR